MADSAARWLVAFAGRRRPALPDIRGAAEELSKNACPDAAIEAARIVWRRRVVNEALSVDLARRLRQAAVRGLDGALEGAIPSALARLEEDEVAHVDLASAVLEQLGGALPSEASSLPELNEPTEIALARLVLTGLCVCEAVSAARFAAVREHTDLAFFRACIEVFHRDELTHAELGFVLLPEVMVQLRAAAGEVRAAELVEAELRGTLGHLDRVVGLDLERRGGPPPPRPQPDNNPGVVEPAIDAIAFYDAIHREVLPRLEALGLPARRAWQERGAPPSGSGSG